MGISVSAGTAVILVGVFLMLGVIVPGALNAYDRIGAAEDDRERLHVDRERTTVSINESATAVDNGTLTLVVDNAGSTALTLSETTVIIDNELAIPETIEVAGTSNEETDLWLPEETATFTIEADDPESVVVVSRYGIDDRLSVGGE